MILENYTLENTQIKIYDDYITEDISIQKEYINSIIVTLLNKLSSLDNSNIL